MIRGSVRWKSTGERVQSSVGDPARTACGINGLSHELTRYACIEPLPDGFGGRHDGDALVASNRVWSQVLSVDDVACATLAAGSIVGRHGDVNLIGVDVAELVQFQRRVMAQDTSTGRPQCCQHEWVERCHWDLREPVDPVANPFDLAVLMPLS